MKSHPDVLERELLQAAEACLHGAAATSSDQERITLADRLTDAAMSHLRRSQALAELARRVRAAELWRAVARSLPGGQPPA